MGHPCDIGIVTQPANGQLGTRCSGTPGSIASGTGCDLSCDDGYTLTDQPVCIAGALSSSTATCTANTCILPVTPVDGYDLTGMSCSSLQTDSIACEVVPTCLAGYTGAPSADDFRCSVDGAELSVGGCMAHPCDIGIVTQPINGQLGTNCSGSPGSIASGAGCDLSCDDGYMLTDQPACIAGALSSSTARCITPTLVARAHGLRRTL